MVDAVTANFVLGEVNANAKEAQILHEVGALEDGPQPRPFTVDFRRRRKDARQMDNHCYHDQKGSEDRRAEMEAIAEEDRQPSQQQDQPGGD